MLQDRLKIYTFKRGMRNSLGDEMESEIIHFEMNQFDSYTIIIKSYYKIMYKMSWYEH